MLKPPEACRASMERARELRYWRGWYIGSPPDYRAVMEGIRQETREILRALRALRRAEEAGLSIRRAVAVREGRGA